MLTNRFITQRRTQNPFIFFLGNFLLSLEGNPRQVLSQGAGKALAAILAFFSQPMQFGQGKTFEAPVANIFKDGHIPYCLQRLNRYVGKLVGQADRLAGR